MVKIHKRELWVFSEKIHGKWTAWNSNKIINLLETIKPTIPRNNRTIFQIIHEDSRNSDNAQRIIKWWNEQQ